MSNPELFIIIFGAVLCVTGAILFAVFAWFREGSHGRNVIRIYHAEFELSHPALVIFAVGALMIVVPFFSGGSPTEEPRQSIERGDQPGAAPDKVGLEGTRPDPFGSEFSTVADPFRWELKAEPPLASNGVGARHYVIVTLWDLDGLILAFEVVRLRIVEGPHAGFTLEASTNEDGQVFLGYVGEWPGVDSIRVWAGAETFDEAPANVRGEVFSEWF